MHLWQTRRQLSSNARATIIRPFHRDFAGVETSSVIAPPHAVSL
jgi:hypothetical protein